jgi:DNA-3-methyladenine glycosylase II
MSQPSGEANPSPKVTSAPARSSYEVEVLEPYRLDLTVHALRRLSTNVVDLLTPAGEYLRARPGARGPVIVRATQKEASRLTVTIEGAPAEHARALAAARRMLGVDRDLTPFYRAAEKVTWLSELALRMRGLKPPRYPTLWEAFFNAVTFQQVSLHAASAITRRWIFALGEPLEHAGVAHYAFPTPEQMLDAGEEVMRATGLSANKLGTLRRAAESILSGALDESMLEERNSADASALLQKIKGIGPWTATVILLRGLGRLDVFPMKDSSVTRNLALVAGPVPLDVPADLATLRPQQGMLYYHLLLARLESRGAITPGSLSPTP